MDKSFEDGFTFAKDNLGASLGGTVSEQWLNSVNEQVEDMKSAMIFEAKKRSGTDIEHLQGWMNEIWHEYTFNTNARIHDSQNTASIPSAEGYASVDNLIKDNHGNVLGKFSLKSDGGKNGGTHSGKDQAKTPWECFNEGKKDALRKGKDFETFDEYLEKRYLKKDDTAYMSKYLGQGKVVDKDMLLGAKKYVFDKYRENLGVDDLQAARYKEVLDSLTDCIEDGKGDKSISLNYEDAKRLAQAAKNASEKDESFNEDLLKECGLDISKLVSAKDIAREALTAGISAASLSLIISIVPTVIDALSKVIHDEGITKDDLAKYGLKALTDSGRSFFTGSITAAITVCCQTGKWGKALVNVNVMGISSIVTVVLGTAISGFKLATKQINHAEMAREIMQLYTTTGFSFVGGTVLASVCEGFPLAYMLGSFIGSVVGGLVYKLEDHLILSFCQDHDCTFFGLVEQNYTLPDSVLEEMGLSKFGFEEFQIEEFKPNEFHADEFTINEFKYDEFGIKVLRRDLIGVYKIGYSVD